MDGKSGFAQRRAGDTPYWEAGSGETVVAIADKEPTPAHVLLAEDRHVIVFATPADAASARRIGNTLEALGIGRFDLLGEGAGAAAAVQLALAYRAAIGSVLLAAPDGQPDEAVRNFPLPVLMLAGTKGASEAADRYRRLLPDCHFMFVYDAERDIGVERPEALAYIAREFFERRDLFLVSRESGMTLP